jgi:perosamine synthetase
MNIPLFKIYWDNEDIEKVNSVIKRGAYWTTGPAAEEFESKISDYIGSEYCVTFNSGTSALHSILLAYGIAEGDEVIVPSFTFIATANAPLFTGAKPIFADIEEKTFGLDPQDVEKRITNRTRAIIPVHFGGSPCLINELKDIAEDHNLLLIEDAAESFGGMINNQKLGTFGDSAMFSFCQNKIITTGDGGCITTNSKDVYEKLKLIRSHGRQETSNYFSSAEFMDYVTLGYNFRISDITAALGVSQINKVDRIIQMRRNNAKYLTNRLSSIEEISVINPPKGYFHVYQMYTIRVAGGPQNRNALMKHLSDEGIGTKVYFHPVHLMHFYRNKFGYKGGELPCTEELSNQVLSLPMYPTLTKAEMDYIAKAISRYFSEKP